jgi:hypothetical protein
MLFKRTILATSLMSAITTVQGQAPSNAEIWEKMQELQQQITAIQAKNSELQSENQELKEQLDATEQVAIEASAAAEMIAMATERVMSNATTFGSTNLGGYGEAHYNNLDDQTSSSEKNEIDFHRFVFFVEHEFNDKLRFFSELELEHSIAGEGKSGEIELEQAYIEYDLNNNTQISSGLFLTPVGIMNETHEPPTFYGTERNPVEKNIIPATWWSAGAMVSGGISNGFSYDFAATSGLNTSLGNSYKIRNGRQKVSKAVAKDFAYTGRLRWTAIPGIELGATVQIQEDITQSLDAAAGSATLFEAHAVIQQGDFGLRALYATWDLNGAGPKSIGADEQTGFYLEPSYRINDKFGLFARYNQWDNTAGSASDSEYEQIDFGINWWPHEDMVIKIDYQDQDAPTGKAELDGFNIGFGFQF